MYDKNTRSVKPMYAEVHLPDTGPTMVEGSEGNLWVALKDGGVMRVDTCGSMSLYLPGIKVMKLIKSNDQNIWIGSQDHGVFCFSPQGAVIHHYDYNDKSVYTVRDDMARALCQDLEGNIWVGYRSGLSKIEVATGKIFHYQADPNLSLIHI